MASHPRRNKVVSGFDNQLARPELHRGSDDCAICLCLVRDPVKIVTCGHAFCRYCLMELIRLREESNVLPRCPTCRSGIARENIVADLGLERETLELQVVCKNETLGCRITPELRNYEAHVQGCEYNLVSCPLRCGRGITKRSIHEHKTNECSKRVMFCSFCRENMEFEKIHSHLPVCPRVMVRCQYCNREGIVREELDDHMNGQCPEYPIYCEFYPFGCDNKIPRRQLKEHHEDNEPFHADLLSGAVQRLMDTVTECFPRAQARQSARSSGTVQRFMDTVTEWFPWAQARQSARLTFTLFELSFLFRRNLDGIDVESNQPGSEIRGAFVESANGYLREDNIALRREQIKLHECISELRKRNNVLLLRLKKADERISRYLKTTALAAFQNAHDKHNRGVLFDLAKSVGIVNKGIVIFFIVVVVATWGKSRK